MSRQNVTKTLLLHGSRLAESLTAVLMIATMSTGALFVLVQFYAMLCSLQRLTARELLHVLAGI